MSKKYVKHYPEIRSYLKQYAESRALEFNQFTEYHMRVIDDGFTTVDVWSSGKYFIKQTNYYLQSDEGVTERYGEHGRISIGKAEMFDFLDDIFYAVYPKNERIAA